MTKKIVIADYLGPADKDGTPIGHLLKVIYDLHDLLSDDVELSYAVCSNYADKLDDRFVIEETLPPIPDDMPRYKAIMLRLKNIQKTLKTNDAVWFINVDVYFFLLMPFIRASKKQIYITNYRDYVNTGSFLKRLLYNITNKKIFCEFTTCRGVVRSNHVYIPDYWFDEDFYDKYKKLEKKKQVIFCGTMSVAKDINGLIEAFNANKQPLSIAGRFAEEKMYNEAVSLITGSNIEISDRKLTDDEYCSLIGSSMFVVLPYKRECYQGRSSGVILEALFMDTIVIAPKFLLDYLGIEGIGYENINELEAFSVEDIAETEVLRIMDANEKVKSMYSKSKAKELYMSRIGTGDE